MLTFILHVRLSWAMKVVIKLLEVIWYISLTLNIVCVWEREKDKIRDSDKERDQ